MTQFAIDIRHLGKRYEIYTRPIDRFLYGAAKAKVHWALKGVNIEIPPGRCLGIVGVNGAGKSTLLKLVTGVIRPTEGMIRLASPPLALLELGTGFNGELTGRENLFATGALLGYSAEYITEKIPVIREFADIGDYFEQPLKVYSSGMFVRLAFALYVNLDCEVLIVDEALSVGDFFFQQKCAQALHDIKKRGTTILFVSHDTAAVQEMADVAILLEHGCVVEHGNPIAVISRFYTASTEPKAVAVGSVAASVRSPTYGAEGVSEATRRLIDEIRAGDMIADAPRSGEGRARILALRIVDVAGQPTLTYPSGSKVRFEAVIEASRNISHPNWGLLIADDQDRSIWSAGSPNHGLSIGQMAPGDRVVVSADVTLDVHPGLYRLNVAAAEHDPSDPAYAVWDDVRVRCLTIEVTDAPHRMDRMGLVDLPMEINAL